MTDNINISVIIPSYKPQDYIFECLDSLVKQTLSKDLWEVIIILNGCNEPWYSSLKDYIQTHDFPNARLIQTDEAGVSNARNIGLDNAKGEYITFIDDDDYVSPLYLSELLTRFEKDTIVLAHPIAFNDTTGQYIENYYIENTYLNLKGKGPIPFSKARKVFQGPCMKLFHRDIINKHRFNINFKNGEDSLFMFEISYNFKYIIAASNDAVYFRRVRMDGAAYGKKSKLYLIRNSHRLIHEYCSLYFSRPFLYNFSFFITRILGAIRMSLH